MSGSERLLEGSIHTRLLPSFLAVSDNLQGLQDPVAPKRHQDKMKARGTPWKRESIRLRPCAQLFKEICCWMWACFATMYFIWAKFTLKLSWCKLPGMPIDAGIKWAKTRKWARRDHTSLLTALGTMIYNGQQEWFLSWAHQWCLKLTTTKPTITHKGWWLMAVCHRHYGDVACWTPVGIHVERIQVFFISSFCES